MKRRKQSIKFRPKYAGRVAKEWSGRAMRTLIGIAISLAILGMIFAVRYVWAQSDAFKIRAVILQGDIPTGLEQKLPFERDGNMWMLRPVSAERAILAAFPELKSVSVRRSWSRNVVVTGHFRAPVAWFIEKGKTRYLDKNTVGFDLPTGTVDPVRLPELQWGNDADRERLLEALLFWAARSPSFSAQIRKCETDTIHRMHVKLTDGTIVDWGAINTATLETRTQRLMRVKENYHPTQTPARLLFVTDDRLIMDSNWAATKPL